MTTPQKDTAGSERDAFEDYARRDGLDVTPRVVDSGLTYLNSATEHAWQFWQASRRHLPEINISRYDEADYGGMKPKAKGEWVRYEDAQEAVLRASQPSGAAGEVPKPLDDPRLQQLFGDAIEGALALGYQNSSPPPDGHWLWRFWNIARAEAADGEVVREFVNELGNAIRITIEGPTSTSENVLTPMEVGQLRGALNEHAGEVDVAGIVAEASAKTAHYDALAALARNRRMVLEEIAGSKPLTATPQQFADHLQRLARKAIEDYTFAGNDDDRASLASPSSGGWQWVPVEPTEEMVRAGNKKTWPLPSKDVYRAMLAVLPPAPKSSGESHE